MKLLMNQSISIKSSAFHNIQGLVESFTIKLLGTKKEENDPLWSRKYSILGDLASWERVVSEALMGVWLLDLAPLLFLLE